MAIDMATQSNMIPDKFTQFAEEVAKLAAEAGLNSFAINFKPGYDDWDLWRDPINAHWEQGRHGEDRRKININSTVTIHHTVIPKAK